jgi:hypothetical protein
VAQEVDRPFHINTGNESIIKPWLASSGDRRDRRGYLQDQLPVTCDYTGRILALGRRGKHFWIQDDKIGHGKFRLTHGIPLDDVAEVTITERQIGGSGIPIQVVPGVPVVKRVRRAGPRQVTEIAVRTKDGQEGLWLVDHRGGDWVKGKLGPQPHQAGILL